MPILSPSSSSTPSSLSLLCGSNLPPLPPLPAAGDDPGSLLPPHSPLGIQATPHHRHLPLPASSSRSLTIAAIHCSITTATAVISLPLRPATSPVVSPPSSLSLFPRSELPSNTSTPSPSHSHSPASTSAPPVNISASPPAHDPLIIANTPNRPHPTPPAAPQTPHSAIISLPTSSHRPTSKSLLHITSAGHSTFNTLPFTPISFSHN